MTFLPINNRIALVKKKKQLKNGANEQLYTNYMVVAPRKCTHKEQQLKIKQMEQAGTNLQNKANSEFFKDRQDMKHSVENSVVEKSIDELFASRMKLNQEVFEGDIKDDNQPQKKLKKKLQKNETAAHDSLDEDMAIDNKDQPQKQMEDRKLDSAEENLDEGQAGMQNGEESKQKTSNEQSQGSAAADQEMLNEDDYF